MLILAGGGKDGGLYQGTDSSEAVDGRPRCELDRLAASKGRLPTSRVVCSIVMSSFRIMAGREREEGTPGEGQRESGLR